MRVRLPKVEMIAALEQVAALDDITTHPGTYTTAGSVPIVPSSRVR